MPIQHSYQEHHLTKTQLRGLAGKYWPLVTTVFVTGILAMYICLLVFFTEIYETNTSLLVKVGRENVETPATVQRGQVVSQGVQASDINSEVQLLSSRDLVETVVDRLGPDAFKQVLAEPASWTGYPKYYLKLTSRQVKRSWAEFLIWASIEKRLSPRESDILRVADGIKVDPVRDSDILQLKVRMPSPKLCVDVANAVLEVYFQRRTAIRRSSAGSDFFGERLSETKALLAKLQAARSEVRERWQLDSPQEQRSIYLRQYNDIESELLGNEAEIAKLKKQREIMALRSAVLPEMVTKEQMDSINPSIQSIKERITALKLDRSKALSHYQPSSEVVKKMDAEIADLYADLGRENKTVVNSVTTETNPTKMQFQAGVEQGSVQVAGLESRSASLRGPAAKLARRVRDIDRGLDGMEAVDREYHRAEQDYATFSLRLEEARMSEELDARRIANVVLVGPPETPIKPVSPRKLFLLEIAMPVSLLLGIGLAALLETTEDRILDERSIAALDGVVYLGTADVGERG